MSSDKKMSPLQQAFFALEKTQARLEALQLARRERIAIVGMACRFPGGVATPDEYWRFLCEGRSGIGEVPADRWDVDRFYDPDPEAPGKMYSRYGGFLDDVRHFDADFFQISRRNAISLDPQQRWLLETSWEALEDAGLAPHKLYKSLTGVFVGLAGFDYSQRVVSQGLEKIDAYFGIGNSHSAAAGRLSYFFGFQGPSVALDTACSSSLVAVHLACQSLRTGECNLALAGGANALLDPILSINFAKARMLAADGRCKTFDARADGYVRGEGVGMVVLKRLGDAVADGDPIHAVIRGSATNQDGPSGGLTVPNGPAQEAVIRRALEFAGLDPNEVGYVEAHGTGTQLGDPIEIGTLQKIFGQRDEPLRVGSVKTNFGHLETAAGIAGLIKAVLAIDRGKIPPHLNFDTPNPNIRWNRALLEVPTDLTEWKGQRRVAGVSSFGFSGTNVHVVIERAAAPAHLPGEAAHRQVLTVSARTETALESLCRKHATALRDSCDLSLQNVAYTFSCGRTHFPYRCSIVAESIDEAAYLLDQAGHGMASPSAVRGQVREADELRLAMLFPGQGCQYSGMGRSLFETEPVFRAAMERCDGLLQPVLGRSLLDVIYSAKDDPNELHQTAWSQPALFAIEYALAHMWMASGVRPTALLGHSIGELVAACIAEVFSLQDGLRLIAERGRLMQALPQNGAMFAVPADHETVEKELEPFDQQLAIAAYNGVTQTVISGDRGAANALVERLAARGIESQSLNVSHAFHSPLMEPMLEEFSKVARSIEYHPPTIPIVSTVTGEFAEDLTAAHWCRQVTSPVRFLQAVERLRDTGNHVCLEAGPKPVLTSLGQKWSHQASADTAANSIDWITTLNGQDDDWRVVTDAQRVLYARGVNLQLGAVSTGHRIVRLPTYAFQRREYWIEPADFHDGRTPLQHIDPESATQVRRVESNGQPISKKRSHPLLGERIGNDDADVQFQISLPCEQLEYLREHRVGNSIFFPASAYVELALVAGQSIFASTHASKFQVQNLDLKRAMMLPSDGQIQVQMFATRISDREMTFELYTNASQGGSTLPSGDGPFDRNRSELLDTPNTEGVGRARAGAILHAVGSVVTVEGDEVLSQDARGGEGRAWDESHQIADLYRQFAQRGLHYGPNFQALERLRIDGADVICEAALPESLREDVIDYYLHPVLLDACFQGLGARLPEREQSPSYLPVHVERVRWYGQRAERVKCRIRLRESEPSQNEVLIADLDLFCIDGSPVAMIEGLHLREVATGWMENAAHNAASSHEAGSHRELRDALKAAGESEQRQLLIGFLQQAVMRVLRREADEIPGPDTSFFQLGMDSLLTMEFVQEINRGLGVRIPPESLLLYPAIEPLAGELRKLIRSETMTVETGTISATGDESGTPWISHLAPKPDAASRLFCFHHLGGTAELFSDWGRASSADLEVCPIELPGHGLRREEPYVKDFDTLIETMVEPMLDLLDRPFAFFGNSGGNLIAFELALQLKQRFGLEPEFLFVAGLWAPSVISERLDVLAQGERNLLHRLSEFPGDAGNGTIGASPAGELEDVIHADLELFSSYRYRELMKLECPIIAFLGDEDELVGREDIAQWATHTEAEFRLEILPGDHVTTIGNWEYMMKTMSAAMNQGIPS